jgi:hypothetical protein
MKNKFNITPHGQTKTFQVITRTGSKNDFQWVAITRKEGVSLEEATSMAGAHNTMTRIPATGSDIMLNLTSLNAKGQIDR